MVSSESDQVHDSDSLYVSTRISAPMIERLWVSLPAWQNICVKYELPIVFTLSLKSKPNENALGPIVPRSFRREFKSEGSHGLRKVLHNPPN